jgi:hypothetical protein
MKDMWKYLEEINSELKKSLLCIPPSRACVNEEFIEKIYRKMKRNKCINDDISSIVISPWHRAHQMEFRYKKTKIFEPYIPVLEYGTFSVIVTDWVCAYLTLLPVVEASLRKWMEFEPSLSLKSLHRFYYTFGKYFREHIGPYDEEMELIIKEYIKYLKYSFKMLYMGFEEYNRKNYNEIFNRNLTLHKLEGARSLRESASNVVRISLLLDVISELYLMHDPESWWHNCVLEDPEKHIDFQLRWHLYEKKAMLSAGHDDMLIVQNILGRKVSDKKKKELIAQLKEEIKLNSGRKPRF